MFKPLNWRATMGFVFLLMGAASFANAQALTNTFDQLPLALRLGDDVTITDNSAHKISGTVADLSPSSMTVLVHGNRLHLNDEQITTITHSRHGDLRTGAISGFAVGAGLGVLIASQLCEYECTAGSAVVGGVYAGIGSAIGVGISAMIKHEQLIYYKPGAAMKVTATPLLTRERQGVLVAVGF